MICQALLHRFVLNTYIYFPPLQRLLAFRPTCILLGFSAALAPKFPPSQAARHRIALLVNSFDTSQARVEALGEVSRALNCGKREKLWTKNQKPAA